MKDILFRGKRLDNEQWVHGYYFCDSDKNSFIKSIGDYQDYRIIPTTLGRYTGLMDMNNNKIFEGDIMGLPESDANEVKFKNRFVRVVEWINDGFFLIDNCTMGGEVRKYGERIALEISLNSNYAGLARCLKNSGLDYTVIGNIHDNLGLLTE